MCNVFSPASLLSVFACQHSSWFQRRQCGNILSPCYVSVVLTLLHTCSIGREENVVEYLYRSEWESLSGAIARDLLLIFQGLNKMLTHLNIIILYAIFYQLKFKKYLYNYIYNYI